MIFERLHATVKLKQKMAIKNMKKSYNKTSCFKQIKFSVEGMKVKHTSIASIYIINLSRKYLQK